MVGEWQTIKAEEFCSSVRDGTHDSPKPAVNGKYLVTSKHITGGRVDLTNAYLISQSDFEEISKRSKVDKWDVLISMIGTVGEVCLIKEVPDFAIKNIGLFKSKNECQGKWLYYYLQSTKAKQYILEQSRGTTQAYIPLGSLREFPILVPENPKEMRAITQILGTLDDKIELNRKMNRTLEEMARAIFKSWFVDFDPVHAKATVRREHPGWTNEQISRAACPNLKPEIAALFPDSFEDSELGVIPKGWEMDSLGNVADVNWGDTNVTKKSYVDEGYLAYSAKGPDGFLPYYDYDRTGVVLSAIGANSGFTWLAHGKWSCIKNTIRFWCTDQSLSTEYLFYATLGNHRWPLRGSAQPFVSQADARNVQILKPGKNIAKLFGNKVCALHEKCNYAAGENVTLATLRDVLLPKFISGELRVPDAERIVGRCI